ncbi:unnamed protein product [Rotaria magnacalcarata]|uniref:Uncharacterized protein n=3 Tax=Rotaria magnacalcarata TaxID=392030 RepID=A0A814XMT4_9BILA|nr:unnamed protein product [Rotaria magnacalcarata]CAF1404356.1 unnamed protein product [Rotaria magnacalcarata]
MIIEIACILYVSLIQHIQADEKCYYGNQTTISTINCADSCCPGTATSSQAACCSDISWKLAIPIIIIIIICLVAICLGYFRSRVRCYCQGCSDCPRRGRTRTTLSSHASVNNNPIFIVNNQDLPDYETVTKDTLAKDANPPSYNFVAAHPSDFDIEARVPSAPPQYSSQSNTAVVTTEPNASV